MSRRGENIRKRADGRWEGRYIYSRRSDGRAKYRSVYAHSYKEVKLRLENLKSEKRNISVLRDKEIRTFTYASDKWLAACKLRLKYSTIVKYEELLKKHILPILGETEMLTLTDDMVVDLIKKKSNVLSSSTVRSISTVIKSVIRYSYKQGWSENLLLDIRLPSSKPKNSSALSSSECERLENLLLEGTDNVKCGLYLCMYTGLRIGELCALKWENIDLQKAVMHIDSTVQRIKNPDKESPRKTILMLTEPKSLYSAREIPLPGKLADMLSEIKKNDDCFLLTASTQPMEPRTLQYKFKQYAKTLELTYSNPHVLRHTFATNCIEVGFDPKTLSEILGHSRVEITLNRYVHASDQRKRTQMELLFSDKGINNGQGDDRNTDNTHIFGSITIE